MRAKMRINHISRNDFGNDMMQEDLHFYAVARSDSYPDDGSDENNTYAKFSPFGELKLTIANPALLGKFNVGEEYYLDFTLAKAVE